MSQSVFKIIQITPSYKPAYIYGGPTMSVSKLCEALMKNKDQQSKNNVNFELEVFTTTANGKLELDVNPNYSSNVNEVKVTYFKRITKDHTHFSPALLLALKREIIHQKRKPKVDKLNYDAKLSEKNLIFHIHSWWNLVSIFSCFIAKCYNIPVILSPRGMLTAYTQKNRNGLTKKIIHQLLGKQLLSYCHIHATSEQEKQEILKIITPKSITVIPNLVELRDTSVFRLSSNDIEAKNEQRATNNEQQPFRLIFLSRIEQKKGLELLFEGLANLKIEWRLTVAGSGDEEYVKSLKSKVECLKIDDKISWAGHVKNEDKFKLLTEHDLMVLTSYNENFANVVIESLSVGTAVLVSSKVGLADYVNSNKLGFCCQLNQNDINDKIKDAFSKPEVLMRIRKISPQLIVKDFNEDTLSNHYIKYYTSLLNG